MADDSSEIQISIVLDDGSIRQGFIRVKQQAEEAASGMGASFKRIGETLVGVFGGEVLAHAFERIAESAKELFKEAINGAAEADAALNKMNVALSLAGVYSKETSQNFQAFAEHLKETTTISDDQAVQLISLAANYGKSTAQIKALTQASIEYATATGKDLNSALTELGGTLSGHLGRLGRVVPATQQLTEAQLRAGEAIGLFNQRFNGAAEAQVNTFSGAIKQLGNNFEEMLKVIGNVVVKSPEVIAVIRVIGETMKVLTDKLKEALSGINLGDFIQSMINFGQVVNQFMIVPLEVLYNVAKVVFNSLVTGALAVISGISTVAAKLVNLIAPDSEIAKTISTFADVAVEDMQKFANATSDAAENFLETTVATGIDEFLNSVSTAVSTAKEVHQDYVNSAADLTAKNYTLLQSFQDLFKGASEYAQQLANNVSKSFRQIGSVAIQGLANAAGAGMAAIGKALVKGENIFQAFAGAVLSALGQAAIQMGGTYILMGIARAFSSYGLDPTATGLIATGSALSVLGGALLAIGGGVSGGGASTSPDVGGGGGGGGFGGGAPGSGSNPAEQFRQSTAPSVAVNIQGDVLDSKETGLRIVDLINDAFKDQGAKVIS